MIKGYPSGATAGNLVLSTRRVRLEFYACGACEDEAGLGCALRNDEEAVGDHDGGTGKQLLRLQRQKESHW